MSLINHINVATPVKDSAELSMQTIEAVLSSRLPEGVTMSYTVYNDFSSPETEAVLKDAAQRLGFNLVNLRDLTNHPSPNYLLVLQILQQQSLDVRGSTFILVESDVVVSEDTLGKLVKGANEHPDCGIAAAVTVDEAGIINYPYDFARKLPSGIIDTRKHCSFCCSLLTPSLLKSFDFNKLDPEKHWFDVTISHESLRAGLHNYLFTNLPVVHRPHSSRPWKQLKYTNPLLYYWKKITGRLDKI